MNGKKKQKMTEGVAFDVRRANLPNERTINDLITANNLDGIRSLLNPLTLHHRQSIVSRNVNNKTLLGHACKLGFRDIVKYLLDECEADISERFTDRQILLSPLRVAIDNVDISIIIFLIRRGIVSVDEHEVRTSIIYALYNEYFAVNSLLDRQIYLMKHKEFSGIPPALGFIDMDLCPYSTDFLEASELGDIDKMKTLLVDAVDTKGINIFEENALCIAILNEKDNAEHFLMNYRLFSPKDHVRVLELCGAKFIVFQSELEKGLRCWRRSLRIRNEHFCVVSDEFRNEFKTNLGFQFKCGAQLDILEDYDADLYLQALIVFLRFLPTSSSVLQDAFVFVAQHVSVSKDLHCAINILALLYGVPNESEFGYVDSRQRAIETAVFLFRDHFHSDTFDKNIFVSQFRNMTGFINEIDWKNLFNGRSQFYIIIYVQLLFLLLWKLTYMEYFDLCKNDKTLIKNEIRRILKLNSDPYPTTLLHLAIEEPSIYPAIPFILSCSDDANCKDTDNNTPMHIISNLDIEPTHRLNLINLFADAGGHIDAVNNFGTTPLKLIGDIKTPLKYLSLQCLAAQTIYKHNIKVPEWYPKILASFIKLHSH